MRPPNPFKRAPRVGGYVAPVTPAPAPRPAPRPVGIPTEALAALLGLDTPPRAQPATSIVGAVAPAPPTPAHGPTLTVTTPTAAKRWLASVGERRAAAMAAVDARYKGREGEMGTWSAKVAEKEALAPRYVVDVAGIENRAALAAAVAVEREWAATMDHLRGLYPDEKEC